MSFNFFQQLKSSNNKTPYIFILRAINILLIILKLDNLYIERIFYETK